MGEIESGILARAPDRACVHIVCGLSAPGHAGAVQSGKRAAMSHGAQRYNQRITASPTDRKMSRFPPNSRHPPRFDPRKPQALTEVLGRTSEFLALRAGVEQVTALQRDLAALLPDYLGSNVEPGFIKDGVLALFAGHNALAARLRHIEPRLLVDLQQRGWAVNALKIRVRPQAMKEVVPPKQALMSAAGADALQTLAETLEPSTLQEALAKMAARHHAKTQKK